MKTSRNLAVCMKESGGCDTCLQVPAQGAGKALALQVASFTNQVLHAVPMAGAHLRHRGSPHLKWSCEEGLVDAKAHAGPTMQLHAQ